MCLGVPGKVTSVGEDIHQPAWVDVCGVQRAVNIALVCEGEPSALVGQWVLVHVGFAMSLLDEQEAQDTLEALQSMQAVGLELDEVRQTGAIYAVR
ncbi:hydrogenase maturation factor HybG [Pectobacteriaceae bacterium CE70]|uniref:HypC/HybG/HupF family hydrogenase formation chaperone n=1 Tax=Serratia sp. (strain ATCC 39006) TaxID=104623 RepID=A0A2I5T6N3_SERS3|nr:MULTISPECIES: hydrogenase maturation factor HybG [Enterobacterales]WJV61226.1 hydrogenase maturation factor HybG [Pectobacteriaceae bacterium C52]WJV65553.1 hydrogenase maturation factor HybG [Pectobacteriaceae bacterium CE70]WJY09573.1 hydrogenase maturation factor HybG [Pectobacteriaceae bacterium C80]AUH00223.1 HypC/HybG/HupF family hydrogenase formation chaperone [Serratia sp. ATCC 39006]AUH04543.1 HypC/HybG/HupF family hydrogenase formation chaperone [Serratia sp. ATCC 39006]